MISDNQILSTGHQPPKMTSGGDRCPALSVGTWRSRASRIPDWRCPQATAQAQEQGPRPGPSWVFHAAGVRHRPEEALARSRRHHCWTCCSISTCQSTATKKRGHRRSHAHSYGGGPHGRTAAGPQGNHMRHFHV